MENKDTLKGYFTNGSIPDETKYASAIRSCMGVLSAASDLPAASADNVGDEYKIGNAFYKCELVSGAYTWVLASTATPSDSYTDLTDKPTVNNVVLSGNKSPQDLGCMPVDLSSLTMLASLNDTDIIPVIRNNVLYKTTVATLRKPRMVEVTIQTTDWTQSGSVYQAQKAVTGLSNTNSVVASPAPSSMDDFNDTPFWVSLVSTGQLTFECETVPSVAVTMNVFIW